MKTFLVLQESKSQINTPWMVTANSAADAVQIVKQENTILFGGDSIKSIHFLAFPCEEITKLAAIGSHITYRRIEKE